MKRNVSDLNIDMNNGKWGAFDRKGNIVIPSIYDKFMSPDGDNEQFLDMAKDGKWGKIDLYGNVVVPFVYDEISGFADGKEIVQEGKTLMVIDSEGNQVSPYTWQRHGNERGFHGESIIVTRNGTYGVINCFGEEWISCKWNYIKGRGENPFELLVRDDEGNWYTSDQVC